jgi:hypothetical protein
MRPFVKFLNNVMYEWVHTCNDLGNEHVVAFGTHTKFNGCKMCQIVGN